MPLFGGAPQLQPFIPPVQPRRAQVTATSAQATLTGTGALPASGLLVAVSSSTLAGTGALPSSGLEVAIGQATLTGTGAFSAAATLVKLGSSAPAGNASFNLGTFGYTPLRQLILATSGLVAFWRLAEGAGATTAVDDKAVSNGTYTNGAAPGQLGAVASQPATLLDGSNDYVNVPHVAGLNVGDVFSIECLVKLGATSGFQQLVAKGDNHAQVLYDGTNQRFALNIAAVTGDVTFSTVTTTDTNTWHHLVVTKNGGTAKLYLDGVDRSGAGNAGTSSNTTSALTIGSNQGLSEFLNATIQYVALYNTALSAATVAQHYAAADLMVGQAPLAGAGALAPSGLAILSQTAPLTVTATLPAVGNAQIAASASLSGSGALAASTDNVVPASATLSATAALSVTGNIQSAGVGSLSGGAALSGAALAVDLGTVALTGSASFAATAAGAAVTLLDTILAEPGLVGFWRGEESDGTTMVSDTGANNGTYNGAPTLYQLGLVPNSAAVRFDGENDYASVPDAASLDLGDTFTYEILLKRHYPLNPLDETIIAKGSLAGQLQYNAAGKRYQLNVAFVGSDVVHANVQTTDQNWHHVVVAKNGTDVRLYIDGQNVTAAGTNATAGNNANALTIGSLAGSSEFAAITWQYAAVYNVALSGAQVTAHYNAIQGTSTGSVAVLNSGASLVANGAVIPASGALTLREVILAEGGLRAFWRLEETVGSTAVNDTGLNNGAYQGSPTLGAVGRVPNSKAVTFDGVNDYVTIPDAPELDLGDILSYEVLIRMNAVTGAATIIDKGPNSVQLAYDPVNRRFRMNVNNVAADLVFANVQTNEIVNWHHVVITKSGATSRIYLDGSDVTTVGTNVTAVNNANPLTIGSNQGLSEFMSATAQYVALYNVALTPSQVAAHYAAILVSTPVQATLTSTGQLVGAGLLVPNGDAPLAGLGSFTVFGLIAQLTDAVLTGTASLVGQLAAAPASTATLTGTGALAATGVNQADRSATLTVTANLIAATTGNLLGALALSGTGALPAAGLLLAQATVAPAGQGALAVVGGITLTASATLSGGASLSVAGTPAFPGAVVLAATAALTAAAVRAKVSAALLTATALLAAVPGAVTPVGAAVLAMAAQFTTAALVESYAEGPEPNESFRGYADPIGGAGVRR